MAQFTAGDTVTVTLDGHALTLKIEDASKSDTLSARVEQSDHAGYTVGDIHDFDRNALRQTQA